MGATHVTGLHVAGDSAVHRLSPQCKLAATVAFVLVVVATPRTQIWAFGLHALVIAAVLAAARLPIGLVLGRLRVEIPFVAFAVLLPFAAGGETVGSGWWALSVDGLWASWNILAKASLGVVTSVILTATTSIPDLIRGMERLRVPSVVVAIITFMVRYAEVITAEMRRMAIARQSRGHDPRWLWQVSATARSAGTLFVRSYERGERVHLAMRSRGYVGAMPAMGAAAQRREWVTAAALPVAALVVASSAWLVQA